MAKNDFYKILATEVSRLDAANLSKRHEKIISGFTTDSPPKAIIDGKNYRVFNSNDYLGLRFHPALLEAEHSASSKFGTGPGAVRFISGSLSLHQELEQTLAKFHSRPDAMIFSSAFATNIAVLSCLIKGQSKDTLVSSNTLVISDELNHRSIIEGIRVANLPSEQKLVYRHLDYSHLEQLLSENAGKYSRIILVTDGVFSMVGETADIKKIRSLVDAYDSKYMEGIMFVVDDCHGIGVLGKTGRGVEEIYLAQADVLVGTLGKAFGADGGYVVADQPVIDYLRESAATYIYSNPLSPGTTGAALAAVKLVDSHEGINLLSQLRQNITSFKSLTKNLPFAADSTHAIQPLLVGDPAKSRALAEHLLTKNILVTTINYPVVAKGRDELRLQLSASHQESDIKNLVSNLFL